MKVNNLKHIIKWTSIQRKYCSVFAIALCSTVVTSQCDKCSRSLLSKCYLDGKMFYLDGA